MIVITEASIARNHGPFRAHARSRLSVGGGESTGIIWWPAASAAIIAKGPNAGRAYAPDPPRAASLHVNRQIMRYSRRAEETCRKDRSTVGVRIRRNCIRRYGARESAAEGVQSSH